MFQKCKQDLANAALLTYPDPELPLCLCTDASEQAIGAVIQQYDNKTKNWKPIAFYSKKLNTAQQTYSTYDRELLSIYLSIKYFKHLLEGRDFNIFTDHKPLIFAFKQKNDKASPRQLRHLHYISQFSTNISHISGKDNIVADTLSRLEGIDIINFDKIADDQGNDEELRRLKSNTKFNFKAYSLPSLKSLWCDTSTVNIRPYIPETYRRHIFHQMHELAHSGIKSTVKQVTSRFIWTNMKKDVKDWTQACIACQKNKINRHTKSPISQYPDPDERFSVVHIDLIGPLPPSNGYTYCLTCIDRYTNWMEVVPLADIRAETVARALYENWITRFGVPYQIINDCGTQFKSETFNKLAIICGINIKHTTSYHPQCNGKIERLHRTLKTAIKCHNSAKWSVVLPTVLLGLRSAMHEDSSYTIAERVYGKTIRLPGEFFEEPKANVISDNFTANLRNQMTMLKPKKVERKSKNTIFVHSNLKTCSHVFVRVDRVKKSLEPAYDGPFPVIKRTEKYFLVTIKGKNINISIDRLKPAFLLATGQEDNSAHHENKVPAEELVPKQTECGNRKTRCGRTVKLPVRFR